MYRNRVRAAEIKLLKWHYHEKLAKVVFRYNKDYLAKPRACQQSHYECFVAQHGKNWKIYPDGLALAADWQRSMKKSWDALDPDEAQRIAERYNRDKLGPQMHMPRDLVESSSEVCAYFNPEEGMEMMQQFNAILAGLKRKGQGLSSLEKDAISCWIQSTAISPAFVKEFTPDYGTESIMAVFLLSDFKTTYGLDYLLRRYKGEFFRTRYPCLALAERAL